MILIISLIVLIVIADLAITYFIMPDDDEGIIKDLDKFGDNNDI